MHIWQVYDEFFLTLGRFLLIGSIILLFMGIYNTNNNEIALATIGIIIAYSGIAFFKWIIKNKL